MHLQKLVKVIKERRSQLRISQEDLAQISGVGLRTIKQIESGKGNSNLNTIEKLADVLGLELIFRIKIMDNNI